MPIPVIHISEHGFSPNQLTLRLSETGGQVIFKNGTVSRQSIKGNTNTAFDTSVLKPGDSIQQDLSSLSMCRYKYHNGQPGKAHVMGEVFILD